MKLIDLLVQELPKRGGWPEGAVECQRFVDEATIDFYDEDDDCSLTYGSIAVKLVRKQAYPCESEQVTRDQYESALAASQKPVWSSEGIPPAGCECECQFLDAWHVCKVLFVGAEVIVGVIDGSERAFSVNHTKFRPLRTESERKHEAVLESICAVLEMVAQDFKREDEAKLIYEAIAAGKIPGVKLDD